MFFFVNPSILENTIIFIIQVIHTFTKQSAMSMTCIWTETNVTCNGQIRKFCTDILDGFHHGIGVRLPAFPVCFLGHLLRNTEQEDGGESIGNDWREIINDRDCSPPEASSFLFINK